VSAITLLLGLVMLSASVAPVAIARAPGNDTFGHAAQIGSLPFHKSENTRGAQAQDPDRVNSCKPVGPTVWFKLRRGSETSITADTRGSTAEGNDYDTVLAVYEQRGSGVDGLVEVDRNDDDATSFQSKLTFTAKANTTYYLLVGTC